MEHEARMPFEPGDDLGMLVSAIVIEDDVDDLAGGHRSLDRV
jgi:hypothetical protein